MTARRLTRQACVIEDIIVFRSLATSNFATGRLQMASLQLLLPALWRQHCQRTAGCDHQSHAATSSQSDRRRQTWQALRLRRGLGQTAQLDGRNQSLPVGRQQRMLLGPSSLRTPCSQQMHHKQLPAGVWVSPKTCTLQQQRTCQAETWLQLCHRKQVQQRICPLGGRFRMQQCTAVTMAAAAQHLGQTPRRRS